jgi:hypothetical protein
MSRTAKQRSPIKLALIMVAALAVIGLLQPTVSAWLGQDENGPTAPKVELNSNPSASAPNGSPTYPALMPGEDPFKAHLEKNGASPAPLAKPSTATQSNSTSPHPAGADPFKAFVEQQKQLGKEVGVSPFGK